MNISEIEKNINLIDLVKNIPVGFCIYNIKLSSIEFIFWNNYMTQITGYTMNEINDLGLNKIFCNPNSINDFINRIEAEKEYEIISKNGSRKTINVSVSLIAINNDESVPLAIIKDVTKYKESEKELMEIQERYKKILELSTDSIFIHNNEKFLYVNNNSFKMFGIENPKDIIGQSIYKYIHPSFHDIIKNRVTVELESKGQLPIIEETFIDTNGELINVEVASSYVPYKGKKCIFTFIRNISHRKILENQLRESEKLYKQLIELLPFGVYIFEKDKIILSNKVGLDYLGVSGFDIIKDKSYLQIVKPHPSYMKNHKRSIKQVITNKYYPLTEEKFIRISDNKILDFEAVVTKYPYEHEENTYLIVLRDISDRKKAEELEEDMKEKSKLLSEAAEYEKLRTEFFANISHELRTPINVILSSIQLLDLKVKNTNNISEYKEEYTKYPAILKQNCYRLLRLINNLIDVTKIDSGYFNLNLINANIITVVEDITLSVVDYTENKGISLTFDTNVEERILACDPDKIERIILNLISNAVKFTEPGGNILVNLMDKVENITISVKDTGIGISSDKLKVIFDRFVQVDKSLARNREGSGIGLSLVKSLVEMHKGTIIAKSELNEGSEFIITLPCYLIEETNDTIDSNNHVIQGNLEKTNIEFSDIYY